MSNKFECFVAPKEAQSDANQSPIRILSLVDLCRAQSPAATGDKSIGPQVGTGFKFLPQGDVANFRNDHIGFPVTSANTAFSELFRPTPPGQLLRACKNDQVFPENDPNRGVGGLLLGPKPIADHVPKKQDREMGSSSTSFDSAVLGMLATAALTHSSVWREGARSYFSLAGIKEPPMIYTSGMNACDMTALKKGLFTGGAVVAANLLLDNTLLKNTEYGSASLFSDASMLVIGYLPMNTYQKGALMVGSHLVSRLFDNLKR